jgi:hypothetical protein
MSGKVHMYRRYFGRSGAHEGTLGPVRKGPHREAAPLPELEALLEAQRKVTAEVYTAVDVTKLMVRVADRDQITATLRDQAQSLLIEQWLRRKREKQAKELIYQQ